MKELIIERCLPSSALVAGRSRSVERSYQACVVFVSVRTRQKTLKLHPLVLRHSGSRAVQSIAGPREYTS